MDWPLSPWKKPSFFKFFVPFCQNSDHLDGQFAVFSPRVPEKLGLFIHFDTQRIAHQGVDPDALRFELLRDGPTT